MGGTAQGNTPNTPRVNLNAFAEFIASGPSGRLDCINRQIENLAGDYRPGADFYKDFCDALIEGRTAGTDEMALYRCLSAQRQDVRRRHYDDLIKHWLKMKRWHLPRVAVGRTVWALPELNVSISPHIGLRLADGRTAVARFWLREPEPSTDAIKAVQWLLQEHMAAICTDGVPLVIDIRRERAHLLGKRPFKRGYEDVLRADGLAMAALWSSRVKTA